MEQLSIVFEPGLASQHLSLRSCVAAAVYRRGETRVAGEIDTSPSHLCEKLAGSDSAGRVRGMTLDELERFIATSNDLSPIYYLIDRFIRSEQTKRQAAQVRLADQMPEFLALLVDAGLMPGQGRAPAKKRVRR